MLVSRQNAISSTLHIDSNSEPLQTVIPFPLIGQEFML